MIHGIFSWKINTRSEYYQFIEKDCSNFCVNQKSPNRHEIRVLWFNSTHIRILCLQDTDDDQKMAMLRKAFQMFDTTKSGYIDVLKISTILNTMGQLFDDSELQALIDENDPENSGKINFDGFCNIASHFLEEEDAEAMQQELKEAFRLYDREGNGYITTSTLKEILAALDDKLSSSDLDGIIAEIDTDGSGTVDFDEFMEMMTGD
ncbi:hypothetical protein HF086_012962 [Spodoptera exigua]|uniref:EF-hand domain-containing protein n=4 Tax=Bilateria TaxID=33213 RepID=A0A922MNJ0_SPOEX|nr:hypothetical protein HF086_012962 [Spodoptera exigua]